MNGAGTGPTFCRGCDYPLTGVGGSKCPECGRGFDPGDARSFLTRPTSRRRRWVRRGLWVLGAVLVVEAIAPSRVGRFTWTWPNSDGTTVTSETRWCLVAPRWMPVAYPRVTTSRRMSVKQSGYVTVADYSVWRVGVASVKPEGGCRVSAPPDSRANVLVFGSIVVLPIEYLIDIRPGNLGTVEDLLLEEDGPRELSFGPHVLPQRSGPKR